MLTGDRAEPTRIGRRRLACALWIRIAEEIDAIRVDDLLAGAPLNFGWGRNAEDSKAREGTFYIDANGTAWEPPRFPSST